MNVHGDAFLGPLIVEKIAMTIPLAHISFVSRLDGFANEHARGIKKAHRVNVKGGTDYNLLKDADVVIVAGAVQRRPEMTREDFVSVNLRVFSEISKEIQKSAPAAAVVVAPFGVDHIETLEGIRETVNGFFKNPVLLVPAKTVWEVSMNAARAVVDAVRELS